MDAVQINNTLDQYMRDLIASSSKELTDYELGVLHGLEYALSVHCKRPVMYVNKDRTYKEYDKARFPEYFL